jgi:hypothetical protein
MIMDQKIFKEAVRILRTNTFQNVIDSLQSLRLHRDLMKDEYDYQMEELRHILLHYKKYESQMAFRIQGIDIFDIKPWIPLLRKHQQASVYPDVKAATVTQITEARKEIESIGYSLEEMKMKVLSQAKKAKLVSNDILKIEKQIFVLETAADVHSFFDEGRFKAKEIADFETNKYYDLYRKGRG